MTSNQLSVYAYSAIAFTLGVVSALLAVLIAKLCRSDREADDRADLSNRIFKLESETAELWGECSGLWSEFEPLKDASADMSAVDCPSDCPCRDEDTVDYIELPGVDMQEQLEVAKSQLRAAELIEARLAVLAAWPTPPQKQLDELFDRMQGVDYVEMPDPPFRGEVQLNFGFNGDRI